MSNGQIGKRIFVPLLVVALLFSAAGSFAAGNVPDVDLKVNVRTERNKEKTDDVVADGAVNDITTTTKTETEVCTLAVEVKMRDNPTLDCQLEWYFVSEHVKNAKDKGTTVIFSSGKKALLLEDSVWREETITSRPFVMKNISRSVSDADDQISGDAYKGYIVLVTKDGRILAKASNSSRYLKDEWIELCKMDK